MIAMDLNLLIKSDLLDDSLQNLVLLDSDESFIGILLDVLSSFVSWVDRPPINNLPQFLTQLAPMLSQIDDAKIIDGLCKVLSYLCDGGAHFAQSLIDAGVDIELKLLLTRRNQTIVASALAAMRHLMLMKNHSQRYLPCRQVPSINAVNDHVVALGRDWSIPLWTRLQTKSYDLSKIDLIICENIELFKETLKDHSDAESNFAETGLAYEGQIGLRCIHCGQMPFARAHFSIVYPGLFY